VKRTAIYPVVGRARFWALAMKIAFTAVGFFSPSLARRDELPGSYCGRLILAIKECVKIERILGSFGKPPPLAQSRSHAASCPVTLT